LTSEIKQQEMEWRRSKVLELSSQDIARGKYLRLSK
jgi:hypothetical protein